MVEEDPKLTQPIRGRATRRIWRAAAQRVCTDTCIGNSSVRCGTWQSTMATMRQNEEAIPPAPNNRGISVESNDENNTTGLVAGIRRRAPPAARDDDDGEGTAMHSRRLLFGPPPAQRRRVSTTPRRSRSSLSGARRPNATRHTTRRGAPSRPSTRNNIPRDIILAAGNAHEGYDESVSSIGSARTVVCEQEPAPSEEQLASVAMVAALMQLQQTQQMVLLTALGSNFTALQSLQHMQMMMLMCLSFAMMGKGYSTDTDEESSSDDE